MYSIKRPNDNLEVDFFDRLEVCKSLIMRGDLSKSTGEVVFQHVREIIFQLVEESPLAPEETFSDSNNGASIRPLFASILDAKLFEKLLIWIEGRPSPVDETSVKIRDMLRHQLISSFELIITQSKQQEWILMHPPIATPLLQLLVKLSLQLKPTYVQIYGRVLYELCVLICRNIKVLDVCRKLCLELFNEAHLIFSLLVPLIHRSDPVGDSARDALLLVFALSQKDKQLAHYLASDSDLCPVLATGLSGLYSSLPKKLTPRHIQFSNSVFECPGGPVSLITPVILNANSAHPCVLELPVGGPEWHQLNENEWTRSVDLRQFLHTLDFCNLAVKISHSSIRDQLLHFIHVGFLVPVLGSALHQSAMDEVIAATAYLELFLRRLTEPKLIKLFLNFIMTSSYDSYHIITSLINRLNANSVLGMVTLSLFRTILSFHCEDVMYELIFSHLLPLNHLEPSRSSSNPIKNFTPPFLRWSNSPRTIQVQPKTLHPSAVTLIPQLIRSADLFLSLSDLTPRSKVSDSTSNKFNSKGSTKITEPTKLDSSFSSRSHLDYIGLAESSTDLDNRNEHGALSSLPSHSQLSFDLPVNEWVCVHKQRSIFASFGRSGFLNYIKTARSRISRRRIACQKWSSLYNPSPSKTYQCQHAASEVLSDQLLRMNEQNVTELLRDASRPSVSRLSPQPAYDHVSHSEKNTVSNSHQGPSLFQEDTGGSFVPPPLPLCLVTREHTSSLYQLNYLDDLSDDTSSADESLQKLQPVSAPDKQVQVCSHKEPNGILEFKPVFITPLQLNIHNSILANLHSECQDSTCTCLSTLPELLKLASYRDGNDQETFQHVGATDQLESFLAALDCLPSPGQCKKHFGHLPPFYSWPDVDLYFLNKLDELTNERLLQLRENVINGHSYRPLGDAVMNSNSHLMKSPNIKGYEPDKNVQISDQPDLPKQPQNTLVIAGGIGPFLSVLLNRLSNMHQNCLFTNLLLTDILASLACYPCPLLYELLVNPIGLVVKPSVNTIFKVLRSLQSQFLVAASTADHWEVLVHRARLYLNLTLPRSPISVTVDPDFYSSPQRKQQLFISTIPDNSKPQRSTIIERTPVPTSSLNPQNYPHCTVEKYKQNQQKRLLLPLTPVCYPHPMNKTKSNSKRTQRDPCTPPSQTQFKFQQFLSMTSRVAQTPVLNKKKSQLQIQSHTAPLSPSPKTERFEPDSDIDFSGETNASMWEPDISTRTRNLVFASIVFEEFCCELASICYEHSRDPDVCLNKSTL